MDSVFFDLDGTLWDATRPAYEALRRVEEKYGARPTDFETFCSLMGKPMDEIASQTLGGLPQRVKRDLFEEFYTLELDLIRRGGSRLYPHSLESLRRLKAHFPLYIISNCQKGYIETFLETHHMGELFEDYLSWGERPRLKGENILYMMQKHGLQRPVYVGDTRGDEEAARFAGIPYYHVAFGFGTSENPHKIIHSYKQLEHELLERL